MFVFMKRFSLSCVTVLTCVAALAGAGPVGSASAQELMTGGAAPGAVSNGATDKETTYTASVPFHTSAGIQLAQPTTTVEHRVGSLTHLSNADGTAAGFTFTFDESAIDTPDAPAAAAVTWPVLQDGEKTGYTVTARIGIGSLTTDESCKVRDANDQETSHFHCTLAGRGLDYDWDMHITDDRVDRWVEASGSIKAEGSVSLANGTFDTTSKTYRRGAADVPAGLSTEFDAVTKPGEDNDSAYIEVWYDLLDNGRSVIARDGSPLRVKATVSNKRFWWFQEGSSCEIRGNSGIEVHSSYSCDMVGDYAHTGIGDGHVHYFTDFTVKKK